MSIVSTLTGKIAIRHPTLGVFCREDGAVLNACIGSSHNRKFAYTYGSGKSGGYLKIRHKNVYYAVHRLIAEAFFPKKEGKPHVDHINRNRADNSVSNLRWVSPSENMYNSSTHLFRDKRITAMSRVDPKEYNRQSSKYKLNIMNEKGTESKTGLLPDDIYLIMKPMNLKDRGIFYRAWKQSRKV